MRLKISRECVCRIDSFYNSILDCNSCILDGFVEMLSLARLKNVSKFQNGFPPVFIILTELSLDRIRLVISTEI